MNASIERLRTVARYPFAAPPGEARELETLVAEKMMGCAVKEGHVAGAAEYVKRPSGEKGKGAAVVVLAALTDEWQTSREIKDKTGRPITSVCEALDSLRKKGKAQKVMGKGKHARRVWYWKRA